MCTPASKTLRSKLLRKSYRQPSLLPYPSMTWAKITLLSQSLVAGSCYRIFFFFFFFLLFEIRAGEAIGLQRALVLIGAEMLIGFGERH